MTRVQGTSIHGGTQFTKGQGVVFALVPRVLTPEGRLRVLLGAARLCPYPLQK